MGFAKKMGFSVKGRVRCVFKLVPTVSWVGRLNFVFQWDLSEHVTHDLRPVAGGMRRVDLASTAVIVQGRML